MGIAVGIDIGTTTICACAVDADSGKVLETWTREHGSIQGSMEWEKLQSPEEDVYKRQVIYGDIWN